MELPVSRYIKIFLIWKQFKQTIDDLKRVKQKCISVLLKISIVCMKNLNFSKGFPPRLDINFWGIWKCSDIWKVCKLFVNIDFLHDWDFLQDTYKRFLKMPLIFYLKTFRLTEFFKLVSKDYITFLLRIWHFLGYLEGLQTHRKFWRTSEKTIWKHSQKWFWFRIKKTFRTNYF